MKSIKFLFLLFIFINVSYASDILKSVEILEIDDLKTTFKEIKRSKEFKEVTFPVFYTTQKNVFLKFTLNKEYIKNKESIIEFNSGVNYLIFENSLAAPNTYNSQILELNSDYFPDTIFIKVINHQSNVYFNFKIYEKNEYIKREGLKDKIIGTSYGIVFTAFLYYLAFYLYNREKSYFYYSMTQLSLLILLFASSFYEIRENINFRLLDIIALYPFFFFSNFFNRYFFDTVNKEPLLDKLMVLSLIIYTVEMICASLFGVFIISDIIPITSLFLVYLIVAFIMLKKGFKPASFYLIGWGIMILSAILMEIQVYHSINYIDDPFLVIYYIAPLESLILSFALSYKIRLLENEKNHQKEISIHQNRLASMGEMINNIAHQWRQPLTHLSFIFQNIEAAFQNNKLDERYLENKTNEAMGQLDYMSNTIENFQNFFKQDKHKKEFSLIESINEVLNLSQNSLKLENIDITFKYEKDFFITSYKGEFMQVLFNLVNNAKEQLINKKIENPNIQILLTSNNNNIFVDVSDNALGIDEDIINNIFDPYFTTKEKGLGIGLYMSKIIIEKNMNGYLTIQNLKDGANFKITLLKNLP